MKSINQIQAEIRDDLVCNSLGAGFFEEKFTLNCQIKCNS